MYVTTNKAIDKMIRAFFALLEEKPYGKISVTEFISRAGVSRTTFYRHYRDIYDMYDKVCELMLQGIMRELTVSFASEKVNDLAELFESFCEKIGSQNHYIALLCGRNGDKRFFEIGAGIAMSYADIIEKALSDNELLALKFVTFSCMGTYVKCLTDGSEFDKKYIQMYKKILEDAQKAGGSNV